MFSLLLVIVTFWVTALLLKAAHAVHPLLETALQILLIYYTISIRSLERSAMAVSDALNREDLMDAREKVSHIIGRDTEALNEQEVAGGAVESVAENLVDGVVSPLFFAVLGGAPLAMAYKMINTLDSMVGYKNERYLLFGRFAARMDDVANFIPARLSVPVIALAAQLLNGRGRAAIATAWRDGRAHASPNAGYPEAAFAGALAVKLNGPNYYNGKLVDKPYIGARFGHSSPDHIKKACDIMILSSVLWLILLMGIMTCCLQLPLSNQVWTFQMPIPLLSTTDITSDLAIFTSSEAGWAAPIRRPFATYSLLRSAYCPRKPEGG